MRKYRCGDDVVGLLARDRRSLDILSVKKEAKLSASEIPGVGEGKSRNNNSNIRPVTNTDIALRLYTDTPELVTAQLMSLPCYTVTVQTATGSQQRQKS